MLVITAAILILLLLLAVVHFVRRANPAPKVPMHMSRLAHPRFIDAGKAVS